MITSRLQVDTVAYRPFSSIHRSGNQFMGEEVCPYLLGYSRNSSSTSFEALYSSMSAEMFSGSSSFQRRLSMTAKNCSFDGGYTIAIPLTREHVKLI